MKAERILAHEYNCPKCGFQWFQAVLVEPFVLCIQCGDKVRSSGPRILEVSVEVEEE